MSDPEKRLKDSKLVVFCEIDKTLTTKRLKCNLATLDCNCCSNLLKISLVITLIVESIQNWSFRVNIQI